MRLTNVRWLTPTEGRAAPRRRPWARGERATRARSRTQSRGEPPDRREASKERAEPTPGQRPKGAKGGERAKRAGGTGEKAYARRATKASAASRIAEPPHPVLSAAAQPRRPRWPSGWFFFGGARASRARSRGEEDADAAVSSQGATRSGAPQRVVVAGVFARRAA